MKCPCEQCICLAICVNREKIKCNDLLSYVNQEWSERYTYWGETKEYLPKVIYVCDEESICHNIRGCQI